MAIAAQSALSVASLVVQGFADVETLGGYAPSSLFCLTIALSGERKSTCDRMVLAALRDFECEAASEYRARRSAWEREHHVWTARRKRLVAAAAKSNENSNAAYAELMAMPPEPEPPVSGNRTATDPTYEGLVKMFAEGHPALGLFTDEAGLFVGGHAMNSDNRLKTIAGVSGIWDGTPINRTRAGDGVSTLRGRRLAAHLMVQPVAARPLLADPVATQQGFLARFLIAEPASTIGQRLCRLCDPNSDLMLEQFGSQLRSILAQVPPTTGHRGRELQPRRLMLTDSARRLLCEYHDEIERRQAASGNLAQVRAYASKSAEQAARIAGVLTLFGDLAASAVSEAEMDSGIALARYYLSEACRLADAAVLSAESQRADALRRWLVDVWHEQDIVPREIVQRGPHALRETKKAKAAIAVLVEHGWLVPLPEGELIRGRQRKEAYRIVRPRHVG